ncbi:hypothetical protein D320_09452, partial [Haloferax sp. BAB-2207]
MLSKLSVQNFRRVLDNPQLLKGEVSKTCLFVNKKIHSMAASDSRFDVMAEDWDNLLILDGCRYDIFKKRNTIDGTLKRQTSPASQSLEFMKCNFFEREFHDTIYITANPFSTEIKSGTFYKVVNLLDQWNEELQTVKPETVVESTLQISQEYPDKRLLIHFMQPHYPFIGEKGKELSHRGYSPTKEGRKHSFSVWDELQYGVADYNLTQVIEAYEENLDIVLAHAEKLLGELNGKSIVTSDHGNLLGERIKPIPIRVYGHPAGIRSSPLVDVPWLIVEGDRRDVTTEEPVG